MPEAIIDGRGNANLMAVNTDGSINVSGVDISIGSLALSLENVYVTSGTVYITSGNVAITGSVETFSSASVGSTYVFNSSPTGAGINNPAWQFAYLGSSTVNGVTGSSVSTITQYIGASSYTQTLTWENDFITNVGSWA